MDITGADSIRILIWLSSSSMKPSGTQGFGAVKSRPRTTNTSSIAVVVQKDVSFTLRTRSKMLHPLNMGQEFFEITTSSGEIRRVSKKRYVLIPPHYLAGVVVRLISLEPHEMPGQHYNAKMAVVVAEWLAKNGFNESGNGGNPGSMGVQFTELSPVK